MAYSSAYKKQLAASARLLIRMVEVNHPQALQGEELQKALQEQLQEEELPGITWEQQWNLQAPISQISRV